MTSHEALPETLMAWARDELDTLLPDTRCQFTASICAHPAVPDPYLCALIYVAVPSLAQLGKQVGAALVLPLHEVSEASVRRTVQMVVEQAQTAAHVELQRANGGGHPDARILQWPPP